MNLSHLSLEETFKLRAAASAAIRSHTEAANLIGHASANFDVALQMSIDERNIDCQQNLVDAARLLAAVLEGVVTK